ncbi:hypothetical protein SacN8_11235 [Sulfolobus acidocaldarius N8]|uniref:Uncharacterized protein n=2 Tax=Sulfolobus acidocaldarius TaxID=2285 RepID=M1J529_9CREN|nr:hypothetical protein SacN8_11235 [Sulfolobus acidocaldarius N8]AGE74509.1 hypothetical protein SacRon12I_11475 [Sulfolobus acidocaldarius Ron12/I]WCM33960.1 hypothetical protein GO597_00675 [Sulfolobus acidocaldarius DSM 639]
MDNIEPSPQEYLICGMKLPIKKPIEEVVSSNNTRTKTIGSIFRMFTNLYKTAKTIYSAIPGIEKIKLESISPKIYSVGVTSVATNKS